MRRLIEMTVLMFSLLVAMAATAQLRGTGRLTGNVVDKNTGKPITGATITIGSPSENTKPIVVKTDSRGHWAAIGMTSGQWNIDVAADGYVTSRGTAVISEVSTPPPIKTELEPEVRQQAPAAAAVETGPTLSPEVVDAIKEGEALLRIKVGDAVTDSAGAPHNVTAAEVKENAKRSVADFEKALPQIPEDKPVLKDIKNQVYQVLAQAYYKAGDVKNAIATLEKLDVADPWTPDPPHTTREVLLANLYLENGQLEQGRALLEKLPSSAITDPGAYINIGILFLNKKNPTAAAKYFTKAIDLDPKGAEAYYYRGLSEVQLRKMDEAKVDLEKVVLLAPDSTEAHDAKQLLANLK